LNTNADDAAAAAGAGEAADANFNAPFAADAGAAGFWVAASCFAKLAAKLDARLLGSTAGFTAGAAGTLLGLDAKLKTKPAGLNVVSPRTVEGAGGGVGEANEKTPGVEAAASVVFAKLNDRPFTGENFVSPLTSVTGRG
jgi:hypothetical protein